MGTADAPGPTSDPPPASQQPHDEFHPAATASASSQQIDESRRAEHLVDAVQSAGHAGSSALPTGTFNPNVNALVDVTPAIPLSTSAVLPATTTHSHSSSDETPSTLNEKAPSPSGGAAPPELNAEDRAAAAAIARKHSSGTHTSGRSSSSSSDDTPPLSKKKRAGFHKAKKSRDKAAKKAKQKEAEAAAIPPVGMFQLFRFATPFENVCNIFGIFLAIAAGACQPLMTLIFGRLTTSFTAYGTAQAQIAGAGGTATPEAAAALAAIKHQLKIDSGHNALYLVAIGCGLTITTWAYMFIWNWTGELNAKRVRERYLHAVLRQDIAYFDDLGAGEVATRIQNDCHLIQQGTSEKVALVAQYIGTFFSGFILAFVRSWRLALALSSMLPVICMIGGTMAFFMTKRSQQSLEAVAKAGTLAEEVIGSVRTVQAFGKAGVLSGNFDKFVRVSRDSGRFLAWVEAGGISIMFWSIYSGYALAFFYGGILVTQGRADAGVVINVFLAILIGSFSMAMITPEIQAITNARGAAAKLFATIDRVPHIDSSDPGGLKPDTLHGTISFDNVKFHYPSRPNVPILKGLTTTFQAGHTVALVGASGSGKSTVVALVERFYDPIEGRVLVDGVDIKDLNVKWIRQQIGLVSQEPTLFATTVRGNVEHGLIGSGHANASDEEKFELVKKACIDANAHDFITKLPNGYDTLVGERGMLLSGGQKQRVAIARAIVSDPRILLLDEATSALDTQSEGIVQDALDKASKGRTTITIAHRLSTIKDADLILVMGGGEILEQGTHDQLLDRGGAYAALVQNQKLVQARPAGDSDQEEIDEIAVEKRGLRSASDEALASPTTEKAGFADLGRATTGRSLASAKMDDIRARRARDEEEEDKLPKAWRLYGRLLKLNRQDKWMYVAGTIGAIAAGMVYPALSILFGSALADFQILDKQLLRHELTVKSRYYFITAICALFCIFVQIAMFNRTGQNLTAKLRSMAFASTMKHDIEWFDEEKNSTGVITSDIADLPQRVQGLFGTTLGSIIQSLATLAGGCIIGLCYGPLLALIGIACIPLLVSGGYIRLRVVVLKDQKMKKIHAGSAQMASEAAASVRTVASLTREDDVDNLYRNALEGPLKVAVRGSIKSQALYAASQGMSFIIIAIVFYIGSLWIISGRYDTAHFFTVLNSVVFASIQAGNVFTFVPDASKANNAAASLFRLYDYEPTVDPFSAEGKVLDPAQVEGHVRIEGVHFRYPTRPGVRVLRDLTIDVPPGTYVALVGPSGCGKSTTIQLVERFYDPLIGRVTLDGVDVRDLNAGSYRDSMALVSQEPTLYAGTVRFNILLGATKPMEEVTEEEIIQACKDANIYDFITSLPDGFETEVGGKGSQLSGGQKQRIAIARALIRNPKVLLLDEATSALDSQSEKVVQEALDKAAKGRTTIAIAHRLSTIQKADIIYCLKDGKVHEKGTHQELLANRGPYYELVQMQNLSRQH